MEELYSSRIVTEDNFHYSLTDDTINRLAVKVVLRDVQPVPWHEAALASHITCTIETGRL